MHEQHFGLKQLELQLSLGFKSLGQWSFQLQQLILLQLSPQHPGQLGHLKQSGQLGSEHFGHLGHLGRRCFVLQRQQEVEEEEDVQDSLCELRFWRIFLRRVSVVTFSISWMNLQRCVMKSG